ncbi:MAG: bifunctional 5,10-methylenetetrahydrofolate dehydrogenase/5,10-methenyltetrahydrofolate cyclohydrolase [Leptospirales bacterium]
MIHIPNFDIEKSDWIDGKLLYGNKLGKKIREKLTEKVAASNITPGLAVLLAGEDSASQVYVSHKEKAAAELGYHSIIQRVPKDSSQDAIIDQIEEWNKDSAIHGILVQLPLPGHIEERTVLQRILPEKDVDGFHFENIGRLYAKAPGTIPCTPLGIMVMIQQAGIDCTGKNAVVLGRSNIVGKPIAQMLMDAGQATVTICHSKTRNLTEYVKNADILVSAMGVRGLVKPEDIKEGAVVIDVGMHRTDSGLCGDLDYKDMVDKSSFITPVPKGVGPMTIAMLMYNTYRNAIGE